VRDPEWRLVRKSPSLSRVMLLGLSLHFKMLSRSPFDLWVVVASPLIFATLAHFLFQEAGGSTILVAALASGVMGVWSSTTASGAAALQTQRRLGVLELLAAAPMPLWAVLLPISIAISGIGIYSLAVGVFYVRVIYGVPIAIHDWFAFVAAVPIAIAAIGALGFLFASALVRFRSAFAPTWGMRALRHATLGSGQPWLDLAACAALAALYLVAGVLFLRIFLRSARANASLALS
jgi:ABC-2 type transport system permease protein